MAKDEIIKNFIKDLKYNIDVLENFISYLNLSEKDKEFYDKVLKLLKSKYKNIKKSNSDDLGKHLRLKKLIKDNKKDDDR